ncbi:hypothetical protein Tco_0909723 [Tanacetum coccineum]|uniref:Uncharacterized protein n=1 Tax=Tanacetum coccineum TaxID=301880 RepID=A0ABQ5CSZ6_9ASTR
MCTARPTMPKNYGEFIGNAMKTFQVAAILKVSLQAGTRAGSEDSYTPVSAKAICLKHAGSSSRSPLLLLIARLRAGTIHSGWLIDTGATVIVCADKEYVSPLSERLTMDRSLKDEAIDKFVLYKPKVENSTWPRKSRFCTKVIEEVITWLHSPSFVRIHGIRHELSSLLPNSPSAKRYCRKKKPYLEERLCHVDQFWPEPGHVGGRILTATYLLNKDTR